MKLSIWVVNKYSSGYEDGFETRTMAIAREWVRAGHDVVIFNSNANHITGKQEMEEPVRHRLLDGIHVVRVRTLGYDRTASLKRILSWIHFEYRLLTLPKMAFPNPTIVISSSLSLLSVISGIVFAARFKVPWVFEVRDIWPLTFTEYYGTRRWHPLAAILAGIERFGYLKANLVVGTMPNLRAHVRSVVKRDVPVVCVPFGFSPSEAPDALPTASRSPQDSTLVVGYAGSIGLSNSLETLVEAIRFLRSDPRFRFVIAGDGDRRSELMAATSDCPNVTWLGRVPRSQVHGILSKCDLLYFATKYSRLYEYGISLNKLTDYLLSARPILGSHSGYPTIVDESGCGKVIPSSDSKALVQALEEYYRMSPDIRLEMGRRGRDWLLKNRTWARIASDYLDHLRSLV
jgi:glycosyltransferase involved in cell wall biosynthesis